MRDATEQRIRLYALTSMASMRSLRFCSQQNDRSSSQAGGAYTRAPSAN